MSTPTPTGVRAMPMPPLAGATGTYKTGQEKLIGQVEVRPLVFHLRSSSPVEVRRAGDHRGVIEKAIELLRGEHLYMRAE